MSWGLRGVWGWGSFWIGSERNGGTGLAFLSFLDEVDG